MTIHFEGASDNRKELVQALADATGIKAEYLGAPAFDYKIGNYIVHRDGSIEADDLMDTKEIGVTLQALRGRGFIPLENEWNQTEEAPTKQEMQACLTTPREDGIALSFPKDGLSAETIENVKKLIAAKAPLIKLALELDELPVEEEEDKLTFTWLPVTAPPEMVNATARLLAAIIKLAKRPAPRYGYGTRDGQPALYLPLFPAAARLHRRRVQDGAQVPDERHPRQRLQAPPCY